MQRDVVPLNDHVHDNVDWYKKAGILNFHDDDDVDDAQVSDGPDDDDDEAEVYDDVDDAQVDDDVEETDTSALPLETMLLLAFTRRRLQMQSLRRMNVIIISMMMLTKK